MKIAFTAIIDENSKKEVEKIDRMINADSYISALEDTRSLIEELYLEDLTPNEKTLISNLKSEFEKILEDNEVIV